MFSAFQCLPNSPSRSPYPHPFVKHSARPPPPRYDGHAIVFSISLNSSPSLPSPSRISAGSTDTLASPHDTHPPLFSPFSPISPSSSLFSPHSRGSFHALQELPFSIRLASGASGQLGLCLLLLLLGYALLDASIFSFLIFPISTALPFFSLLPYSPLRREPCCRCVVICAGPASCTF